MNGYSIAQAVKHFIMIIMLSAVCSVQAADSLTVVFTGDILLDRGVRLRIKNLGADALFSPSVDSLFSQADYVVGNLECPATEVNEPVFKRFVFRAEPEWLNVLKHHGITHLNLANNHSIDQGRRGLVSTIDAVRSAGIIPFGAGTNMVEAAEAVLIAREPREVFLLPSLRLPLENMAYLSDKPCVSQESFDDILARIRLLREQHPDAVIIVTLHWGVEHTLQPTIQQRLEAHQIIDAGADAIIGHHTHTLQTVKQYKGRPIYYSLGNFIFDQQKPINTRAAVVKIIIKRQGLEFQALPVDITGCVPIIKTSAQ